MNRLVETTPLKALPSLLQAPADPLEFPVTGMTCASCVSHVEHALAGVPGVQRASVNLALGTATVERDPDRATMDALVQAVEAAGYGVPPQARGGSQGGGAALQLADATTAQELARLRRELWVAAIFTVPLVLLAMGHGAIAALEGPWGRGLQLALATPVVLGPGARFFGLAWRSLQRRRADMNTLVALGAGSAFLFSVVSLLSPGAWQGGHHGGGPDLYFEAAASIITFVLLGKVLETGARRHLADAVHGLMSLQPAQAHRLAADDDEEADVNVADLRPGDRVRVRAGERVPADGQVESGASELDESMLTGESVPVPRGPGDGVTAGATNGRGTLVVRVTGTGRNTVLGRIIRAVEQAQGNKAPMAALADRVAAVFVPVVLGLAALTWLAWVLWDPTAAGVGVATGRMVAVLVMACPCALGLATPAAVAAGTGRAAQLGVLFKGGTALEAMARVTAVMLDKTGTLTTGRPVFLAAGVLPGTEENQLLATAAAVESASEHPVARALVEAARARGLRVAKVDGFAAVPGRGVEGHVDGRRVLLGTAGWLAEGGVDTAGLEDMATALARQGGTPVLVAWDGRARGVLAATDGPATGAAEVVSALVASGVTVRMVTGDRPEVARRVADAVGIHQVDAQVSPEGKAALVTHARGDGWNVAMVGDGLNDAPALAAADVGVAMGTGTDVAASAADVVLMSGGLAALPRALDMARATVRTMRQNLFWAFAYNVAGLPVAAGLLYPFTGWLLSPMLASAAMSLSSVSVLANALRLRRHTWAGDRVGRGTGSALNE